MYLGGVKMKVKYTLTIDEEQLNEVKKQAIDEGVNYSELICKAIELYLLFGVKGSLCNEERL